MGKKNIRKLKFLVEELSDRDARLKLDYESYNKFFEHIPCNMIIWEARSRDSITVVNRAKAGQKESHDIMNCPAIMGSLGKRWSSVTSGNITEFVCYSSGRLVWNKVVPIMDDGKLYRVIGITWDLSGTSKFIESICLEKEHGQVLDYSLDTSPSNETISV